MAYERMHAEVSLKAISANMRLIRGMASPHAQVMAVVKADGYGHGIVQAAKAAAANGAGCLGVAICEEGLALRESGVGLPIVVLGYTPDEMLEQAVKNGLSQTVCTYEGAAMLSKAAARLGKTARAHIKVDTGMNRLGFVPGQAALMAIEGMPRLPALAIEGVFTHFAAADAGDLAFTETQFALFEDFTKKIAKILPSAPIRHCSNSAGLLDGRRFDMDMARPGIILYGLPPSGAFDVRGMGFVPAMSLKSRVSMVKRIEPGDTVSYGRKFQASRPTVVATISAGYADGYARSMSQGGRVLIRGRHAPVIGAVCMDQFMADVTGIHGARIGDEAVLMGRQGDNEITAEEIAEVRGTICYEVVCGVGKRVPRVYLN